MNASTAAVTELATPSGMAGVSPPRAQVRAGPVLIRHLGMAPSVHPDAYVAPTAVLSGQVSIGAGSCTCTARSWPPRAARCRSAPAA